MPAAVTLTLAEAAAVLDPPLSERQLRLIIVKALAWEPDEYRHTGRPGRPTFAYDAERILRLHAALLPFTGGLAYGYGRATHLPRSRSLPLP
jgi:hypothetical protein